MLSVSGFMRMKNARDEKLPRSDKYPVWAINCDCHISTEREFDTLRQAQDRISELQGAGFRDHYGDLAADIFRWLGVDDPNGK